MTARGGSSFCFNPLPPPKRGETSDAGTNDSCAGWRCFNPLPPPKRGETTRPEGKIHQETCFNPLPPPKRGETSRVKARMLP